MTQAIIDPNILAAVSAFAGVEQTRYYLEGVRVEIAAQSVLYVATDGHRLLAWREIREGRKQNDLVGSYTIPSRICRHFKDRDQGVLSGNVTRLELKSGDEAISFTPLTYSGPKKEDWVDWRRVIPKEPPTRELGHFNGDYIGAFTKFAHKMTGDLAFPVVFHNGPKDPAIVRFPWHADAIGVLMPMRWEEDKFGAPLPDWVAA